MERVAAMRASQRRDGACVSGGGDGWCGGVVKGKTKSATVQLESMGGIGLWTNLTHGTSVILR